jgi:hypothetical protein
VHPPPPAAHHGTFLGHPILVGHVPGTPRFGVGPPRPEGRQFTKWGCPRSQFPCSSSASRTCGREGNTATRSGAIRRIPRSFPDDTGNWFRLHGWSKPKPMNVSPTRVKRWSQSLSKRLRERRVSRCVRSIPARKHWMVPSPPEWNAVCEKPSISSMDWRSRSSVEATGACHLVHKPEVVRPSNRKLAPRAVSGPKKAGDGTLSQRLDCADRTGPSVNRAKSAVVLKQMRATRP